MREYLDILFEERQLQKITVFKLMLRFPSARDKQIRIAEAMNITMATLNKLLAELMEDLDEWRICTGSNFQFNIINPETTTEYELELLKRFYLKDSVYFRIIDRILFSQPTTQQELIEQLQLSSGTYYKRLKELNQRLKELNFEINTFQLIGDERRIRTVIATIYATYFLRADAFIPLQAYDSCEAYVDRICNAVCRPITPWQRHYLTFLTFIAHQRIALKSPLIYTANPIFDLSIFDVPTPVTIHHLIRRMMSDYLPSSLSNDMTEIEIRSEVVGVLNALVLAQVEFKENVYLLHSQQFIKKRNACIRDVQTLILQRRGYQLEHDTMLKLMASIKNIINEISSYQDTPYLSVSDYSFYNIVKATDYHSLLISDILTIVIQSFLDEPTALRVKQLHSRYFQEYVTCLSSELDFRVLQPCVNIHFQYSHLENNKNLLIRELSSTMMLNYRVDESEPADIIFTDIVMPKQEGALYFFDDETLNLERWQQIEKSILNYVKKIKD
jgi:predicted transcriptional regulator